MNYVPDLATIQRIARTTDNNMAPVFRDVPADLETPVSAFLKVARGDHSFLLESVEGGERVGRYSFIGTEPYRVFSSGPFTDPTEGSDPLREVEEELSRYRISHPRDTEGQTTLPRFTGGAVGFLAYDVVRHFEPRVKIPAPDPQGLPEALFMFVDTLLVFDHVKHNIKVVSHCRLDGDVETSYRQACWRIDELAKRLTATLPASPYPISATREEGSLESNVTRERYHQNVERCKEYIVAGDVIQVVPSQRLSRKTSAHPFSVYRALRNVNPSPYMYYLQMGDAYIVGASPEMLVRVEDGVVVDALMQTSVPGVFAAGDVARYPEVRLGEQVRIEHWVVAERQGQAAARAMLGLRRPFRDVPFFWSVHYDVTLSYVGHAREWDAIDVRGDLAARDAVVVFRRSGIPLAVVTVGRDRLSLEVEAALERNDHAGVETLLGGLGAGSPRSPI
jgi:anthranilate synthase component 1